jgi:hypothetical protein
MEKGAHLGAQSMDSLKHLQTAKEVIALLLATPLLTP